MKKEKPVLVTTLHRGVFFGWIHHNSELQKASIELFRARNVIYWSADLGGFLGLASIGPNENCKIGAMVDAITLFDVTSISDVSESAVQKWKSERVG